MTQQEMYLHRAEQGATLDPHATSEEPTYITHVRETIDFWCDADRQAQHRWFVTEMGGYPSDGPSVEAIVTAHQEHFYPNPLLYRIVDPHDAYIWRALADSERQMIALIEGQRPQQPTSHTEYIHCPNCEDIQKATVEHTAPWYSYVHFCTTCGYTIMESEWEQATEQEVVSYKAISAAVEKAIAAKPRAEVQP